MLKQRIKPFPDEILEYIAGILAETRAGSEITRFFSSAGYSEFAHDGTTKKWFILACLKSLNTRQDGPYHVIKIIDKMADPKQYMNALELHQKVIEDLNLSLIFHDLQINKENKVIISKEPTPIRPLTDSRHSEVDLFRKMSLHPSVREVSERLFFDGHYSQAIKDFK